MKKLLTICLLSLLWGCSNKAIDLSGETTIKPDDYVKAFTPIKGNYTASDTNFVKKADTIKIKKPDKKKKTDFLSISLNLAFFIFRFNR